MLNTLFSPTVLPDEKKRILSEKYNIAMTTELESEVQRMCNLGTAIESKARDEGCVAYNKSTRYRRQNSPVSEREFLKIGKGHVEAK